MDVKRSKQDHPSYRIIRARMAESGRLGKIAKAHYRDLQRSVNAGERDLKTSGEMKRAWERIRKLKWDVYGPQQTLHQWYLKDDSGSEKSWERCRRCSGRMAGPHGFILSEVRPHCINPNCDASVV